MIKVVQTKCAKDALDRFRLKPKSFVIGHAQAHNITSLTQSVHMQAQAHLLATYHHDRTQCRRITNMAFVLYIFFARSTGRRPFGLALGLHEKRLSHSLHIHNLESLSSS